MSQLWPDTDVTEYICIYKCKVLFCFLKKDNTC